MNENPVKITIENYKERTLTFIMPEDTTLNIGRWTSYDDRFCGLDIEISCEPGKTIIETQEELKENKQETSKGKNKGKKKKDKKVEFEV